MPPPHSTIVVSYSGPRHPFALRVMSQDDGYGAKFAGAVSILAVFGAVVVSAGSVVKTNEGASTFPSGTRGHEAAVSFVINVHVTSVLTTYSRRIALRCCGRG